jgi:hypothetical protein
MESLLSYYSSYTGTAKLDHFNAYPGWGAKTIARPDGTTIDYRLYVVDPAAVNTTDAPAAVQPPLLAAGNHIAKIVVRVGDYSKSIKYEMRAGNGGTGGGTTVDNQVTAENNSLLHAIGPNGAGTEMITSGDNPAAYQEAYENLQATSYDKTYTSAGSFISGVASFVNSFSPVSPYDTITIKCACTGNMSILNNLVLPSNKKVMIHLALGDPPNELFIQNSIFQLNGMLLVDGNLRLEKKGNETTQLIASNVMLTGEAYYDPHNNNTDVVVQGTFASGTGALQNDHSPQITPSNNQYIYPNKYRVSSGTVSRK